MRDSLHDNGKVEKVDSEGDTRELLYSLRPIDELLVSDTVVKSSLVAISIRKRTRTRKKRDKTLMYRHQTQVTRRHNADTTQRHKREM